MSPVDVTLAGEMTLRGLLRRRLSLVLLVLLPLTFYAARHDHVGQSIRFLVVGVAWAVSTVAFFAATAARQVERRLGVAGWSWPSLLLGRIGALLTLGAGLSGGYLLLVVVDQPVRSNAGVALDLASTTVVAVLLGSFLGSVASRELEGALLLFIVSGLQFMVDPATTLARFLPFWSTRELATYAVDGADAAGLAGGLLHATATALILATATAWLSSTRMRVGHPKVS
jgi:hypothetical protein